MNQPQKQSEPRESREVRVGFVRFVTKDFSIMSPNKIESYIEARKSNKVDGYDIAWVEPRRAFRFDRYINGALHATRWIPESRIEVWEEMGVS